MNKKWLEVSNRTDGEVAKLAAAHIITRANHPSNVIQVGDQVFTTGVTKEDYGIGPTRDTVHNIDQLSAPGQDAVRRAVASQYNLTPPAEKIQKGLSGTPGALPVPGEGGDHVLSQAAKKVAKAVVEHAKANLQGVAGGVADRAKQSIHDLYSHYAQQDWEKVLGAAQRYLRNMQGRGSIGSGPTGPTKPPMKTPSPSIKKSLVPFKGAPLVESNSTDKDHEGLFHDFGKFADRHGRTEHADLGAPTGHEVYAHDNSGQIHMSSKTTFGKYGERHITHEHNWYIRKTNNVGETDHKESVVETKGKKSVNMGKESVINGIPAVRAHMNSLYTHVKDAPMAADVTKLGKAFEGSAVDFQKALEPVMPIMKNVKTAAGVMGTFSNLAMRHATASDPNLGTPMLGSHRMSVHYEGGENPSVHMISDVAYDSGAHERHHYKIGTTVGSKGSYERFVHSGDTEAAAKGVGVRDYHKASFSSPGQITSHMDTVGVPDDAEAAPKTEVKPIGVPSKVVPAGTPAMPAATTGALGPKKSFGASSKNAIDAINSATFVAGAKNRLFSPVGYSKKARNK